MTLPRAPIELQKAALRAQAVARRQPCDPALGARLAAHVRRAQIIPAGSVVGGFWPLPGEIDIRPLLESLAALGHVIGLPETPPRGAPLAFRTWRPGARMLAGRFGTMHPGGDIVQPDVFLAPLLAYDASGNRLGYGGGYYDRSFAARPSAFRLGCAFAAQEFSSLPVAAHDLRLHAVATERGIKRF